MWQDGTARYLEPLHSSDWEARRQATAITHCLLWFATRMFYSTCIYSAGFNFIRWMTANTAGTNTVATFKKINNDILINEM